MKRLIVCCDGTWQQLTSPCPTNVVKIAQAITPFANDGTPQVLYYEQGVGTEDEADKIFGGAFGRGIDDHIQDAYRFLCLNYVDGDEIYLFGFSRGAYTVRSLAGLIYNSGLLRRYHIRQVPKAYDLYTSRGSKPGDQECIEFRQKYGDRVPITLLGCWDTVGSLGIPDLTPFLHLDQRINNKYRFHDTQLNRMIQNALHAVAIDETRKVFDVTPMVKHPDAKGQVLRQVWFPGAHSCVGGGSEDHRKLSDAALKWMIDSVGELGLGLEFDLSYINPAIETDFSCDFHFEVKSLMGIAATLAGAILRDVDAEFEDLHESAKLRWKKRSDYRPENLKKYLAQLDL
ncbi:DUF2235 domain-containing protein [Allocoleopsis sp.]|uniref:DUF2235 domain-containing protein n=1 Tax=Allocoleopsis sp. TaxID=3088169 RepID=UPI002FD4CDFC